jgi:hypothetical protein
VRLFSLWAGVLGPPVVFLSDLGISYGVANWACSSGQKWVLDVVTLAALGLIIVAAVGSRRRLREAQGADTQGGHAEDRRRFMAAAGLLSCLFFAVAVLSFALPRLVLHPCAQY